MSLAEDIAKKFRIDPARLEGSTDGIDALNELLDRAADVCGDAVDAYRVRRLKHAEPTGV